MIFAAIVAGGTGSRLNISEMPKQFLPLGKSGKPIIIHTLEKFLICSKFDCICLGIHKDYIGFMEDLLEKHGLKSDRVMISEGGEERNGTIMNSITALENKFGENAENIIVTHDAVRPFITLKMIEENIAAAQNFGACDTVINCIDTIISSQDGEIITDIPDRRTIFSGQTPQSFKMSELKELYNSLNDAEKAILTDACGIYYFKKKPIKLVQGNVFNIKITTNSNYKIAQAILSEGLA